MVMYSGSMIASSTPSSRNESRASVTPTAYVTSSARIAAATILLMLLTCAGIARQLPEEGRSNQKSGQDTQLMYPLKP